MKKITISSLVKVIILSLLTIACGEEQIYFPDVVISEASAKIRFVHAASDASGVNFYLNDAKISSGAAANSVIAYASAFPVSNYVSLAGGSFGLKATVPATASVAAVTLASSTLSAESNKFYSVFLAGVAPDYETLVVNDDFSSVTFNGSSYIRFVNLIHNSTNKLTVTAKLGTDAPIIIAQNVAFKESSAFMAIPIGDYTIELRDAVTNALLASASATNRLLAANRTYTFFARGQIRVTPPVNPYPVTLERTINQ
jgi:hypothetical protein